jgi:hypothetical protein
MVPRADRTTDTAISVRMSRMPVDAQGQVFKQSVGHCYNRPPSQSPPDCPARAVRAEIPDSGRPCHLLAGRGAGR